MANDDNYPVESDRRRFVKGVVGGAALSGALATGAVSVSLATSPAGGGGGIMNYRGATRTLGPAPRGLPQIPLDIDDEGYLQGLWPEPETEELADGSEYVFSAAEIAGVEYTTEWYQYCGLQTFQGLVPDADGQDEYLRYDVGEYEWMDEVEEGDMINVDDFEDYEEWGNEIGEAGVGKPATGTWRSQDVPPEETIPIVVIRSERIREIAEEQANEGDEWLQETCPEGFIAFINKCTHFCCVPGYKNRDGAPEFGAEDKIYCNCHNSVYDPFDIVEDQFVSLPRPEDN
ncbi:hypothetical protein [Natrononativus amylolyticus]|uniref:hypothetical protein n=1 Tax=Natrononativus amylolyticus TaxID=2963434 RepID=UPI0020CDED02|nr:hypothetical protein [Natrononativus amylolyticus]